MIFVNTRDCRGALPPGQVWGFEELRFWKWCPREDANLHDLAATSS
jgi:hypothetical protein